MESVALPTEPVQATGGSLLDCEQSSAAAPPSPPAASRSAFYARWKPAKEATEVSGDRDRRTLVGDDPLVRRTQLALDESESLRTYIDALKAEKAALKDTLAAEEAAHAAERKRAQALATQLALSGAELRAKRDEVDRLVAQVNKLMETTSLLLKHVENVQAPSPTVTFAPLPAPPAPASTSLPMLASPASALSNLDPQGRGGATFSSPREAAARSRRDAAGSPLRPTAGATRTVGSAASQPPRTAQQALAPALTMTADSDAAQPWPPSAALPQSPLSLGGRFFVDGSEGAYDNSDARLARQAAEDAYDGGSEARFGRASRDAFASVGGPLGPGDSAGVSAPGSEHVHVLLSRLEHWAARQRGGAR